MKIKVARNDGKRLKSNNNGIEELRAERETTLADALELSGSDRARAMSAAAIYRAMSSYDRPRIARETGIDLAHMGAVMRWSDMAWAAMSDADRAADGAELAELGYAV